MAQKTWAVGEEVLAADFNTYVQNQTVPAFTNTTQRDGQWTAPPNGARCVTVDTDTEWSRVGGAWTVARGQQVAYAQVTANQASITTLVDLTGLSVTFTAAGAGRRYKVIGHGLLTSTVAGDFMVGYFRDGSNAQLGRWMATFQVYTPGYGLHGEGSVYVTPAAGSYTVKLSAERNTGTGTVTSQAAATFPAFISVEAV